MKKICCILVAVLSLFIIVVGFAGCRNSKEIGDDGIVVENEGDAIYYKDTQNSVTLKIAFTEAGFGREWIVEMSKAFVRENKDVRIELEGDPVLANSLFTKLDSGKNLADIFIPLNSAWETYAYKGKIEPLDSLYEQKVDGEEGKTVAESMNEVYREYCSLTTKDGTHYYAFPWNTTVTGIVYNKKMFREYGWEIPKTTAELKTLCDKILADTNGSVKPFVYPGKIGGYFDYIGSTWWMQSVGLEGYKSFWEFGSPDIYDLTKSPASGKLAALTEFEKFFDIETGYSVSGSMSKDHTTAQMDFMRGQAAMIINANWMETEMKTSTPEGFEMGMMAIPFLENAYSEDGVPVQYNYTTAPDYMIIPSEAAQKELAKEFLLFSVSDDMLQMYTELTGSMRPFEYEIEDESKISDFAKDAFAIYKNSVSYFDFSRENIYMKGYAKKYLNGGDPYSLLVRGEVTPSRFCNLEYAEADSDWTTWLESSK